MNVEDMVKYLRLNMRISDPEGAENDNAYLSMTDSDLILYLNIALSRDFPMVDSLDTLSPNYVYGLLLLARKDLYYTLATVEAPLFDLGADNNNYLKRSQRFDHYMALIKQADDEYLDWLENSMVDEDGNGRNTVNSYNAYLPKRWYTYYNYLGASAPVPVLYIREIGCDFVSLEWKFRKGKPYLYRLYIDTKPILEVYENVEKVIDRNTHLATITDVHNNTFKIKGLEVGRSYYIALEAVDRNSLSGFVQECITTKTLDMPEPEIPEEEIVEIELLGNDNLTAKIPKDTAGNFIRIEGELKNPDEVTSVILHYTIGEKEGDIPLNILYRNEKIAFEPEYVDIGIYEYMVISRITVIDDSIIEITKVVSATVLHRNDINIAINDTDLLFSGVIVNPVSGVENIEVEILLSDNTTMKPTLTLSYNNESNTFEILPNVLDIDGVFYNIDSYGISAEFLYSISGSILLAEGITVIPQDIPITIFKGDNITWTEIETKNADEKGNFVFENLSNGEYQIEVVESKDNYLGTAVEVVIKDEDKSGVVIEIKNG